MSTFCNNMMPWHAHAHGAVPLLFALWACADARTICLSYWGEAAGNMYIKLGHHRSLMTVRTGKTGTDRE